MKIGILTQPLYYNYGGLLQNFALQKALKKMGHEPITLDQYGAKINMLKFVLLNVRIFIHNIFGGKKSYIRYVRESELKQICTNTKQFIDKNIKCTRKLKTKRQFIRTIRDEQIEGLVVGSDQVWRPIYNVDIRRSFFDFARDFNIKRVAYAASFGVDSWEYSDKEEKECKELVRFFDGVSVREISAVELCKKYLDVDAELVLDPTLLLEKEEYERLIEDEDLIVDEKVMFCYILDSSFEKEGIVSKIAERLNLIPFSVMPQKKIEEVERKHIEMCVFPAVTEWVKGFVKASFVVCDSFHGMVFSIIFNKPFVVLNNAQRGSSRFTSLLRMFDLEERLISDATDLNIIQKPIDWNLINEKLQNMKQRSLYYLQSKLS